jgi:hypothetical protein
MFLVDRKWQKSMEWKIREMEIRVNALDEHLKNLTGSLEPFKPTPMMDNKSEPVKYASF